MYRDSGEKYYENIFKEKQKYPSRNIPRCPIALQHAPFLSLACCPSPCCYHVGRMNQQDPSVLLPDDMRDVIEAIVCRRMDGPRDSSSHASSCKRIPITHNARVPPSACAIQSPIHPSLHPLPTETTDNQSSVVEVRQKKKDAVGRPIALSAPILACCPRRETSQVPPPPLVIIYSDICSRPWNT